MKTIVRVNAIPVVEILVVQKVVKMNAIQVAEILVNGPAMAVVMIPAKIDVKRLVMDVVKELVLVLVLILWLTHDLLIP
ncbi:MAG: hypothetical protein K2L81_06255 [Muribaculaceae bacterium]|nr:hypothetical protein [Muribaculaceae bacterium]